MAASSNDPSNDPWNQQQGLARLRNLNALPHIQGPPGVDLGPDPSTSQFLQAFRGYAENAVDPEFLEERKDVWKILGDHGHADTPDKSGDWWTLSPS